MQNVNNPSTIYRQAKQLLGVGIAKTCLYPISAFDEAGLPVYLNDKRAVYFTPSGALIKVLINRFGNDLDAAQKVQPFIEEIAKYFPETFIHKYELPVAFDLVCSKKTDGEILSAFDNVINEIDKNPLAIG